MILSATVLLLLTACASGVGLNSLIGATPQAADSGLTTGNAGITVLSTSQATDEQDPAASTAASPLELENLPVTISKNGDTGVAPGDACDASEGVQMLLLAPADSERTLAMAGVGGIAFELHNNDVAVRLAHQVLLGIYGTLDGEDTHEQFVVFLTPARAHALATANDLIVLTCGAASDNDPLSVWRPLAPQKLQKLEMEIGSLRLTPDQVILNDTSVVRPVVDASDGAAVEMAPDSGGDAGTLFYFVIMRPVL